MIAKQLSTCDNGLYKVISGQYLLFKINSKQVRRYNLTINQPDPEKPLDIENYNHCLVTEIPFIRILNKLRKERRYDSPAHQVHHGLLHSRVLQGRSNHQHSRSSTPHHVNQ